ncbi:glycosyltransferase family 2 protein [Aaosphaeria arxii CBS 175.79]|uniref:chitin synthase n=1 Tax=Aaosphaeria arxii CBS 175.79 TaxID=1450172 RepID=A0A6A5XJR7_9PLEO|nr:glycosyltransferase family 2 protein [Aaosphaeria arxii CBS 175.79]KAF2013372.1 glycosyltransferase family 2 protein [Aaosphaeria arxii CBS 175.79]
MSLPQRPDPSSPGREQRPAFRESPSRRRRTSDLESSRRHDRTSSKGGSQSYSRALPSPGTPVPMERDPIMRGGAGTPGGPDLGRKRSLIRPERQRIDPSHPNYHYRKHAQKMHVHPSTTGNDPILEDRMEAETVSSDSTDMKPSHLRNPSSAGYSDKQAPLDENTRPQRRLTRSKTMDKLEKQKQKERDALRPPSLWNVYCAIVTFWCPNAVLKCFGKVQKAQQRAWREKMGLVSIILMICTIVGYLTFGFTETVCSSGGNVRLRVNKVDRGFLIAHGKAYDLTGSAHPLARGVPEGANVLFDLPEKHGGQDASFLFQNVNGACKGLITAKPGSNITTNANNDLAWYFPCQLFNQDGSTKPNTTVPYYNGFQCHTSATARRAFYGLDSSGDVYFTWDDLKNSTRDLMVWGGDVLDLSLLDWLDQSQVTIPNKFMEIRQNQKLRGLDVTRAYSSSYEKQVAKCFTQIIKVGSVDTESIGCIASKVVLYVSLVFILSIVTAKFVLALAFQWFISRKFGADKTSQGKVDSKQRKQQIEEWSDDIYRPPPKLSDPAGPDRSSKRGSAFLPSTSRFTSPYAMEKSSKTRAPPTTMTSQSASSRLISSNAMYRQLNTSHGTLPTYDGKHSAQDSRSSTMYPGTSDTRYSTAMGEEGPGPAGFVHEAVVPQPPSEWQPFGYPLAHAICLVTAYSEGADGLRTTLDSIATTDYPNSHKLILVICDGMIKGKGETLSTPEIALGMMKDHTILPHEVEAFSYVAVASGSKRHNMAKIYSGFYNYGEESAIAVDKQQRVPMMVVVKCGTPDEAEKSKPGNRGKRDSQIILMSFLQKVMFDERMTELEFEIFNGIWKITGMSPDYYEIVLMVDADTKVFPDSLTHMISAMVKDPEIMGLCGETKIANKRDSWVSMIQVFEYFISHHLSKSFESVFGGVTCLPGCFCMYRIKAPKGGQNYWVPILANPDVVEHYSENVVDTLHKKNLLLLGEDRYLSTLMLKTFPKRKQVFVPQAVCKTTVPDEFKVLLSQRRRWINSTVHNLMELVLVRDLCGTFCFSMQFVVFIELVGTLVLPAAIAFTFYLIAIAIKAAVLHTEAPVIPLILLALILGLPAVLIVVTAHRWSYIAWMFVYLLSLPIWNFVLPAYAYWKFDDFSWGDTRKTAGEKTKKAGIEYEGEFDSSKITMRRWHDFEQERRLKASAGGWSQQHTSVGGWSQQHQQQQQQQHGYDTYYDN